MGKGHNDHSPLMIDGLQLAANGIHLATPLNLRLPQGQWLGILGPNGCGKTTLLKTLAGLLPAATGQLQWRCKSLLTLSARQRAEHLAIMVQHNGPCGGLTVEQVVALGNAPARRLDYARLQRVLAQCQLTPLAGRPLECLSGGQLQRTMMAQALFQDTQLLLLDEPANHLDIFHLHQLLGNLRQQPLTTIASFHDINLAAQYCDQLLLMAPGRVVACGTPEQVLTRDHLAQVFGVDAHISLGPHGCVQVTVMGLAPTKDIE
ncbi:ABC transporter ATP-binding protein [Ferrimonas aestuarii]|uniref:ABC transporter ATP-binding protein n=1 Tax=Ferrimonas aestuarii TaxID=2569539 RepID=A0A4U1BRX3_9GAMM|nr:ABC transporter ATP-binding protein [Ferrimonas aestuarii]TKB56062.1 ABC transporter ATP-binding protein [Ferrimonas aestuarii]